jgi:hypothetical protein
MTAKTFRLGQFLLVALGRGQAVARVERITAKRVYYRRLVGMGTKTARWSLILTPSPIETLRIWSEPTDYTPCGTTRPAPPTLADFDRALREAQAALKERQAQLAATDSRSVLWTNSERNVRAARNTIDALKRGRQELAAFLEQAQKVA